ncbi:hypothetical protein ACI782_16465 [Geodermatophilus sp. SYSU D00703]
MRLLRAVVVGAFVVASVLFSSGAATADSGTAGRLDDCVWIWWIPFPCHPE